MKIKICMIFFMVMCVSAEAFSQTAPDTNDMVGWGDVTFIIPLFKSKEGEKRVDKWTLGVNLAMRQGRDLKRPIDERGSVTLTYRLNKFFAAGTGYMYHRFRPTEARRQYEHRIMSFMLAEKRWTKFVFRNRALGTYLAIFGRPDTVVFRNRAQLNYSVKKEKKELFSPFVANEPFYNFRENKWFRNDFFAGISKQINKNVGADFYYLNQGFKLGQLKRTNGFGVSLRYRIDRIK